MCLFPMNKVSAWNGRFARLAALTRCQLGAFCWCVGAFVATRVVQMPCVLLVFVMTQTSGTLVVFSLISSSSSWANRVDSDAQHRQASNSNANQQEVDLSKDDKKSVQWKKEKHCCRGTQGETR